MKRLTRTSTAPACPLEVVLNRAGGGLITADPATADGPQYSEIVSDEVAAVFASDEGLRAHFTVDEVVEPAAARDGAADVTDTPAPRRRSSN